MSPTGRKGIADNSERTISRSGRCRAPRMQQVANASERRGSRITRVSLSESDRIISGGSEASGKHPISCMRPGTFSRGFNGRD